MVIVKVSAFHAQVFLKHQCWSIG